MRVAPEWRWFFAKDYDREVASYFRSKLTSNDICLSVGANIGLYVMQFAGWLGPTGRIHAVEPNPASVEMLRKHLAMNRIEHQVAIHQQAVSSIYGTAKFAAAGADGMSRLGTANPCLSSPVSFIEVPITTIDRLVTTFNDRPTAMMMDIEGFEIAAIQGAREFLTDGRFSAIVIEFHPNDWCLAETTVDDLKRVLKELRLKAIPLTGQNDCFSEYGHVALERA